VIPPANDKILNIDFKFKRTFLGHIKNILNLYLTTGLSHPNFRRFGGILVEIFLKHGGHPCIGKNAVLQNAIKKRRQTPKHVPPANPPI